MPDLLISYFIFLGYLVITLSSFALINGVVRLCMGEFRSSKAFKTHPWVIKEEKIS